MKKVYHKFLKFLMCCLMFSLLYFFIYILSGITFIGMSDTSSEKWYYVFIILLYSVSLSIAAGAIISLLFTLENRYIKKKYLVYIASINIVLYVFTTNGLLVIINGLPQSSSLYFTDKYYWIGLIDFIIFQLFMIYIRLFKKSKLIIP